MIKSSNSSIFHSFRLELFFASLNLFFALNTHGQSRTEILVIYEGDQKRNIEIEGIFGEMIPRAYRVQELPVGVPITIAIQKTIGSNSDFNVSDKDLILEPGYGQITVTFIDDKFGFEYISWLTAKKSTYSHGQIYSTYISGARINENLNVLKAPDFKPPKYKKGLRALVNDLLLFRASIYNIDSPIVYTELLITNEGESQGFSSGHIVSPTGISANSLVLEKKKLDNSQSKNLGDQETNWIPAKHGNKSLECWFKVVPLIKANSDASFINALESSNGVYFFKSDMDEQLLFNKPRDLPYWIWLYAEQKLKQNSLKNKFGEPDEHSKGRHLDYVTYRQLGLKFYYYPDTDSLISMRLFRYRNKSPWSKPDWSESYLISAFALTWVNKKEIISNEVISEFGKPDVKRDLKDPIYLYKNINSSGVTIGFTFSKRENSIHNLRSIGFFESKVKRYKNFQLNSKLMLAAAKLVSNLPPKKNYVPLPDELFSIIEKKYPYASLKTSGQRYDENINYGTIYVELLSDFKSYLGIGLNYNEDSKKLSTVRLYTGALPDAHGRNRIRSTYIHTEFELPRGVEITPEIVESKFGRNYSYHDGREFGRDVISYYYISFTGRRYTFSFEKSHSGKYVLNYIFFSSYTRKD